MKFAPVRRNRISTPHRNGRPRRERQEEGEEEGRRHELLVFQ